MIALAADHSHSVIVTSAAAAATAWKTRDGDEIVVYVGRRWGVEAPVERIGIVAKLSAVKHLELRDFLRFNILFDGVRHLGIVVEESTGAEESIGLHKSTGAADKHQRRRKATASRKSSSAG